MQFNKYQCNKCKTEFCLIGKGNIAHCPYCGFEHGIRVAVIIDD